MKKRPEEEDGSCSRREFFKIGGAVAAGLQLGAVAGAGFAAGKDPSTHTGWQHLGDNTQFVDRSKMIRKGPAYEIVGETLRPEMHESAFGRQSLIMNDIRQYREMIASFNAGEERQEGIGNGPGTPVQKGSPETTGGELPTLKETSFPPKESFKEPMLSWYEKHPDLYKLDKIRMEEIMPKKKGGP